MRRLASSFGVLLILCGASLSSAQEVPATGTAPQDHPAAQQGTQGHDDTLIAEDVRRGLRGAVTFDCDHESLIDVVEKKIAGPLKLNVYYDRERIEQQGLKLDELEVSGKFKKVSARAALRHILKQYNLAYYCNDTGVCITTRETHEQNVFPRVYDVTELLEDTQPAIPHAVPYYNSANSDHSEDGPNPGVPSVQVHQPRPSTNKSAPVTPVRPVQFGFGGGFGGAGGTTQTAPETETNGNRRLTGAGLISAIKDATGVSPRNNGWDGSSTGESISILNLGHAKLMVVKQTEATHCEIEDLLNEIYTHHHMLKKDAPQIVAPGTVSRNVRSDVPIAHSK